MYTLVYNQIITTKFYDFDSSINLMLPLIQVNYLEYNNVELKESAWCTIPFNEESNGPLYMMLGSTIIYFFAPIIIVTLLYSK